MTAPSQPRSGFVHGGDLRLHYTLRGDSAALPLVLVHGMRDHARSWDWVGAALARDWFVIAPDLRGHGDSDHAGSCGYGIAAFVLDLARLVDSLALERIALVGHSLGGAIALRFAAAFPDRVRALCLIEGLELPNVREQRRAPRPYPEQLRGWFQEENERQQRAPRVYASVGEATARMAEQYPALAPEIVAHVAEHGLRADPAGGWRWKYDNAARFRAPDDADGGDLDAVLAAVACPTLLLYGEDSWIPVPPAERLARLRDHRVVKLDGASHWLHHQLRTAFLASLRSFLLQVTEGQDHA